jgi:hypothetical protein
VVGWARPRRCEGMRGAALAWLTIVLLCGMLLPSAISRGSDPTSAVTVTFVQAASGDTGPSGPSGPAR